MNNQQSIVDKQIERIENEKKAYLEGKTTLEDRDRNLSEALQIIQAIQRRHRGLKFEEGGQIVCC